MNVFLRFCCSIMAIGLFSCNKNIQTPSYPSYYGKWQFIGSYFGPIHITPSPDSVVILTLKPDNTYVATLNGNPGIHGAFTIDSSNFVILTFLNITQPFGTNTSGESNGVYFIGFNTAKVGQLTMFQTNATSSPGDSLNLTSYPITPEFTSEYFKRIQ